MNVKSTGEDEELEQGDERRAELRREGARRIGGEYYGRYRPAAV